MLKEAAERATARLHVMRAVRRMRDRFELPAAQWASQPTRLVGPAEQKRREILGGELSASEAPCRKSFEASEGLLAVVLGLGLVMLGLAVVAAPQLGYDQFALPKELVLHFLAVLAAAVVMGRRRGLRYGAPEIALVAFLLLSAVAGVLKGVNADLVVRSLSMSTSTAVIFVAARNIEERESAALLIGCLAAAVGTVAALAFAEGHGVLPRLSMEGRAPGGTLGNRNFLAHVLVIGFPAVVLVANRARERGTQLVWMATLAIMTAATVLSRSRAAWLATLTIAAVAAGIYALLPDARASSRNARWPALVGAIAIGAVLGSLRPSELLWASSTPLRDTWGRMLDVTEGTGRGRVIQYRNTVTMIKDHPVLGVGPGNWSVHYPLVASRGDPSYDASSVIPTTRVPSGEWLGVVAERGLLGAAALVAVAITLSLRFVRAGLLPAGRTRAAPSADAVAGLLVVVGAGVLGLVDVTLSNPMFAGVCATSIGLWMPRDRDRKLAHSRVQIAASLLVALVLFAGVLNAKERLTAALLYAHASGLGDLRRALRANPAEYRAGIAAAHILDVSGECNAARSELASASRLFPYNPVNRVLLQRCR